MPRLADKVSTYLDIPSVVTAVVVSGIGFGTVHMFLLVLVKPMHRAHQHH